MAPKRHFSRRTGTRWATHTLEFLVSSGMTCDKKAFFFECFPYVCPEPVLVKRSVLYYITSGQKVPCSHLLLPLVVPPAVVLDGRDGQLDVIKVRKELPDEKGSVK